MNLPGLTRPQGVDQPTGPQGVDQPTTPHWVDHLATLSGFRDRELLDVSLAGALRDLLRPLSVAVVRCVGQPGDERWLVRARLGLHDLAATSDGYGLDIETLPVLHSQPERLRCLVQRQIVQAPLSAGAAGAASAGWCTRFPLATDRDVVGVLELHSPQALGVAEQRLVTSVLRLYGNVLGLLDYSERDTLTGLLNRKTFDVSFMRLASLVPRDGGHAAEAGAGAGAGANGDADAHVHRDADAARAAEAGAQWGAAAAAATPVIPALSRRPGGAQAVWLGLVDIDHFKRVNDLHGHLIGDEVLLLVSRLMRNSFRFDDQLYRFGGEEFVILMRCAAPHDASQAFQRLRSHVQAFDFPRAGRITVSLGFTQVRAGDTPSAAFERADQAVYVAKQRGRNQVLEHAALVAAGVLQDEARASDIELF